MRGEGRQQAQREVGRAAGPQVGLDRAVGQRVVQVGRRRHAGKLRHPGEAPGRRLVRQQGRQVDAGGACRPDTWRCSPAARRSARPPASLTMPCTLVCRVMLRLGEEPACWRWHVEVGMQHHDRPLGRDLVEVAEVHAPAGEVDRIEAPGEQGRAVLRHASSRGPAAPPPPPRCSSAPSSACRPGWCGRRSRHRETSRRRPRRRGYGPRRSPAGSPCRRSARRDRICPSRCSHSSVPAPRMRPSRTATWVANGWLGFMVTMRRAA